MANETIRSKLPSKVQSETKIRSKKQKNLTENILLWILRVILGLIFVFPLYYALLTSVQPVSEMTSGKFSLITLKPTMEYFKYVFTYRTPFGGLGIYVAVKNTLILTALGMVFNLVISSLAAYSFAKIKFRGHKIIFRIFLTSMMIPGIITMVPTFEIIKFLKLWGNIFGAVLPGAVSIFNIFFLRQFFLTLPDELGESAQIDGANVFIIFVRIYIPLIKTPLATLAIFCFQGGWNNFLMPYVVLPSNEYVLSTFIRNIPTDKNFGQAMAASMVATLPVLIIFIVFQKYFMQSLDLSGLKE